jgi:ElaB/YqjD/DUF883 family membrane-anchored ribosome-binding protein
MNAEQKTSEEIEAEIDRVRARMDATLDEIEHRLSPREMIRDGLGSISRIEAGRYALQLAGLARRYPMPAAVAGLTLAGLLVGRRLYSGSRAAPEEAGSASRLSRALDAAKGTLRDTSDSISGSASSARSKFSRATADGVERASEVADKARKQLRRAGKSAQSMASERPLAVGAAALAVGAAIAVCVPYFRKKM